MKIIYDNETDNIYVKFTDDKVIVDYHKECDIVAVEVLNVKQIHMK